MYIIENVIDEVIKETESPSKEKLSIHLIPKSI